jgi:hypothetical protein
MKKLLLIASLFFFVNTFAQVSSYTSSSSEMIFSFANIKNNGNTESSNLRWAPVFNIQVLRNHDFGQYTGLFYGIAIRNVGFIYDTPKSDTMHKFRTYNACIPVGFKLGKVKGMFLFGGYELEMPFHYKEKLFINEEKKEKTSIWFSNRVPDIMHALYAGINFKRGLGIKFKYYLTPFFNQNVTETVNGVQTKPFQNFKANVFYIGLSWNMFKDVSKSRKNTETPPADNNKYSYLY